MELRRRTLEVAKTGILKATEVRGRIWCMLVLRVGAEELMEFWRGNHEEGRRSEFVFSCFCCGVPVLEWLRDFACISTVSASI